MRQGLDALYRYSGWAGAFFLGAIGVTVVAQVSLNLIDKLSVLLVGSAIGLTIPSYADFTGFFLAASSFLALAYTLREGGHIRVTLVIQHLRSGPRRIVELWCIGLAASIVGYFLWYSLALTHESFFYNDLSPGMVPVPLWIPQSAMSGGLLVLNIALIDELWGLLRGESPSYDGKGENLLQEKNPTTEATGDEN
ncbi:MAG: TRAP transporter small permease [Gammaproteobacteria bacterium]|nr:TRAP transporter small permease [Gammaproteobacteria bacterium]